MVELFSPPRYGSREYDEMMRAKQRASFNALLETLAARRAENAKAWAQDPMSVAQGFAGSGMIRSVGRQAPRIASVLQRDATGRPTQRAPLGDLALKDQRLLDAYRMDKGLLGIPGWHGSGAKFDKFDDSFIGTGEGNQAFGYGHYQADVRGTAGSYQPLEGARILALTDEANARLPNWIAGRLKVGGPQAAKEMADDFTQRVADAEGAVAAKSHQWWNEQTKIPHLTKIRDDLRFLAGMDDIKTGPPGYMYRSAIKATPDEMLNWDLPLSQQPPKVKAALKKAKLFEDPNMRPDQFIHGPEMSARMRKAGIKGIRYKDQMSRKIEWDVKPYADSYQAIGPTGKGPLFKTRAEAEKYIADRVKEPTYNYVMFSDKDMKVLKRMGLSAPIGLLADQE